MTECDQSRGPLLSLVRCRDCLVIRLAVPACIAYAFPSRVKTASRMFRKVMRRHSGVRCPTDSALEAYRVNNMPSAELRTMYDRLERTTRNIIYAPLGPKAVEETLEISPAERIRWSKDGRLTTKKSVCSRGRGSFALPLYSAETIANLKQQSKLLASWRQEDNRKCHPK